jgi:NAD(P)-dependent dehydrogenase (short-subunit alcohol dehydrogenase family)
MEHLSGKSAVVTGGASGIGRALAEALAREGMRLAVADIDGAAAESTAAELRVMGAEALGFECDVSERASVEALAQAAHAAFGPVAVLCNNAGVANFKKAQDMEDRDWNWVLGVDLVGVVNGIQAFLPAMVARGEPGHVLNTASIAGLVAGYVPGLAAYTTAKYGVVGLSESLRIDLAEVSIGVSVICPGGVLTNIRDSGRHRPPAFGGPRPITVLPGVPDADPATRLTPEIVAEMAVRAIKENQMYVLTHQSTRAGVERRFRAILEAYDYWAATGLERYPAPGVAVRE